MKVLHLPANVCTRPNDTASSRLSRIAPESYNVCIY